MREASPSNRLRLYESLLDSLNDSVLVFAGDQQLFFVNQRFCDATGLEQSALVGTPITDLQRFVTDDRFPAFQKHVEDVLTGATDERRIDLSVQSPLEGPVVVEARITPVSGLEEPGCAVVLRDLTTKLDQAKALEQKVEQLAVLTRLLRHDIRNDMNVIVGWADRLTKFDPSVDEQEIIDRITNRGAHTIELTYLSETCSRRSMTSGILRRSRSTSGRQPRTNLRSFENSIPTRHSR